jgi:hypothetical protein
MTAEIIKPYSNKLNTSILRRHKQSGNVYLFPDGSTKTGTLVFWAENSQTSNPVGTVLEVFKSVEDWEILPLGTKIILTA